MAVLNLLLLLFLRWSFSISSLSQYRKIKYKFKTTSDNLSEAFVISLTLLNSFSPSSITFFHLPLGRLTLFIPKDYSLPYCFELVIAVLNAFGFLAKNKALLCLINFIRSLIYTKIINCRSWCWEAFSILTVQGHGKSWTWEYSHAQFLPQKRNIHTFLSGTWCIIKG